MSAPTCPYCDRPAKLVNGNALYPHRPDLIALNFWNCSPCNAYVGCHKRGAWVPELRKTSDGTIPLGRLANAELRRAKAAAHAAFDPIWKAGVMTRREAYAWLASQLRISEANCHIGMFDADQCKAVAQAAKGLTR